MTTASAAATSPTDGSECPWREILFVPAVRAGRVFQQDIPTEGEVNYEQTPHNRIWSWIWCFTKQWSYSLKILPSLPPSSPLSLWELIKHWTAWGQALAQSEKEKDLFYHPILTVRWISHFIGVCEKRLKDFSFRKFNYFLLFTCQLTFYLLPSRTLNSDTSTPFGGHTSPDTSNTSQCMNNWIFNYFLLS